MRIIIAEQHYDNSGLVTCAASSDDVSVNSNSRWQILDTNLLY